MRVVHILGELRPSGAELMYYSAAPLWRTQGIDIEIVATGVVPGKMAREFESLGIRVHHLPFSPSPRHILEMARFLQKSQFDVVHLDTERANCWYGLAACMSCSSRVFRTVHNVFPFTGALRIRRGVQRHVLRHLGVRSIAISPSVQNTEMERFGNRTELVPNWFDSRKYRPPTPQERAKARAALQLPDDAFTVCTVGGCWPFKNHDAIIRALTRIPGDLPLFYLHAGTEQPDHAERKLAQDLKVARRIRFLGEVVPDVLPILHASDVYLMPSLYEGFGCAAIEAMATGLPSILSRVQGLQDFQYVCTGIYWIQPTPESIAAALLAMFNLPPATRSKIGIQLSSAAHRHFGLEHGAQMYAELYWGAAGGRRRSE
jgi:glycosyltransferase involved in cell wall biosynthesis